MKGTNYTSYEFYARGIIDIVSDKELDDPEWLRALRKDAARRGVSYHQWHEHLANLYRDAPAIFVVPMGGGAKRKEQYLNMEVFELPNIEFWFRDFCKPVPDDVKPRVRKESRERVRILGTILRAYPLGDSE